MIAVDTSVVTFVPQCPQKGRPASTGFAHLGHAFVLARGDTREGGSREPEPTDAPGIGASGGGEATFTAANDAPAE